MRLEALVRARPWLSAGLLSVLLHGGALGTLLLFRLSAVEAVPREPGAPAVHVTRVSMRTRSPGASTPTRAASHSSSRPANTSPAVREGVVALEERHEEEVEGEGGEGDAGSLASPAASAEAADGVADGPGPETVTAPVPDNLPALVEERLHQAASGCYPDAARRFRVKGQVEVGFCVEVGQVGARVELHGTSGSTLLDRAVTQCVVAKAAPFPLPAVGQCFTVLVRFGVE